jgi:predicted deacylase
MKNMKNIKILILSGTHGNEMSAVQLGIKLKKYYNDPDIKVIPFLNESGLICNEREVQPSNSSYDLNRSFKDEIETHGKVTTKIKELIDEYDVVIDIHNSHRCANFCLVDISKDYTIQSLCKSAGVEYASRYSVGGTIKDYTNQIGKIGITYEFSGMSTLNNSKELKIATGDIISLVDAIQKFPDSMIVDEQKLQSLHTLETGFIDFIKDINDIVQPGDVVFKVFNELGEVIEEVINEEECPIKIMAIGHSFQTRGSSVLQYIKKV